MSAVEQPFARHFSVHEAGMSGLFASRLRGRPILRNARRARYSGLGILTLKKMMYVAGETGDPHPDTTAIIEEVVREQVTEIVSD